MANVLLISYDNGSHIPFFPQNLAYLTQSLIKGGHKAFVWHQDLHHGRPEALTKILDENQIDMVGLGFVAGYWQYRMAKEIGHAVNSSARRKLFRYVLGGHGPAAEPDWFLDRLGADAVVVGDGEKAIRIAAHGKKGVIQGEPCDQDEGPFEVYEQWARVIDIYRLIRWPTSNRTDFCFPILSSRGCKWSCSFCYRMRDGFHERAAPAIMEEIKFLHDKAAINHFQFSDELLMSSEARAAEISEAILKLPFSIKWDCNGRLNYAKPEVLALMRKSGCEYVNYGIESLDQKILNEMGKGLTVDRIYEGVEDTLKAGISPGLNFIWGFLGDHKGNLHEATQFIGAYDPAHELRTIRPVTPYPGTPLYRKAIADGLLAGPEDFYERKHVNSDLFTVNFMRYTTEQAHEYLLQANCWLMGRYMRMKGDRMVAGATKLYMEGGKDFRGFREV